MKSLVSFISFSFALLLSVCTCTLAQDEWDPEALFEQLWRTFDSNYALFVAKQVDWDALYAVYRPRVTAQTNDEELFDIVTGLLGHLNDNHVRLYWHSKRREFCAGILNDLEVNDFDLDLVKEKYLGGRFESGLDDFYQYGWLNDRIGYFHFSRFGHQEEMERVVDRVVELFKDADAMIVDDRSGGGDDLVGQAIASRFADRKRLYMITRIRSGPQHDDFTPPRYWYLEPAGPRQFTKPVILLTHRRSRSAAENFALAMRVLPHVTVVGDFTSGCFADAHQDKLPIDWYFSVSYKEFRDHTGFCWEGIGVPPDIMVKGSGEDIEAGHDKALEFAINLIETGMLKPNPEPESLQNLRVSLAHKLGRDIEKLGLEAALAELQRAREADPSGFYFDMEELWMVGNELLAAGKAGEAEAVLDMILREFPDTWSLAAAVPSWEAYLESGADELKNKILNAALQIEYDTFPWQRELQEQARRKLKQ